MPSTLSVEPQSSAKTTAVPATAMPLISPTALLRAHLRQTPPIRPSGRLPNEPQHIDLNVGSLTHTHGSSVIKIGATTIVCGVRAEVIPISDIPSYDPRLNPPQGDEHLRQPKSPEQHTPISLYNLLVPNLELSTGCSALHQANTVPSTQAQALSQRLYSLLLTSNLVHSSDLAITYTPPPEVDTGLDPDDPAYIPRESDQVKAFWVLYIDMLCISYGGEAGVFDAAWLSLYVALRDTVVPHAWWDADEKVVLCDPDVSKGRRLRLHGCPVPLGFAVVNDEGGAEAKKSQQEKKWIIVDPDAFEEQCCDEVGCVVVDVLDEGEIKILKIEKSGGGSVGVHELKDIVNVAGGRRKQWQAVMENALQNSVRIG